jgi:DNA-binding NarL/FixJ family response regulator
LKARVILADDHLLVTQGIGKLLEGRFDLVGTVGDGRAAIEAARDLRPDVILLDVSMPLLNGIEAARQIRTLAPETKIVMLSMHADPMYVSESFRAGCSAYVLKRSAASELVFSIEEVLRGRHYLTPAVKAAVERRDETRKRGSRPASPANLLTPRQREVLQLVAEGKSIKEISRLLDISVKTVEFHKARIMSALDLRTTADLTKFAVAHGIASLES